MPEIMYDVMDVELIRKYNVPGPRYTSYPTVPFWENDPSQEEWKSLVKSTFKASNTEEGISLYLHLPFCESLCTYCGCNTRITVNHKVEVPYIDCLIMEWELYLDLFEEKPLIKEIHLGGGTPTFFSPDNLKSLLEQLLAKADIHEDYEFSFEAHPKNTSLAHLQTLFDLGFRRLSLGIQDFDPKVQEIVNRVQPFEMVEEVVNNARKVGYRSINFDLIYGLPLQTIDSVRDTIEKVNLLKPERIAFYSYAHVPWVKPGQRKFTEDDLPSNEEKRALYELGKLLFEQSGYKEIGMDHFAVESDSLYQAMISGKLHRNFMGYTSGHNSLMIGLGASSISDSWNCFGQNIKKVEDYKQAVLKGEFPIYRGHVLNEEDLEVRRHILNVMCHFETEWNPALSVINPSILKERLLPLMEDGLVTMQENKLQVTEKGQPFVRNICMCFDERLYSKKPENQIFSQTV